MWRTWQDKILGQPASQQHDPSDLPGPNGIQRLAAAHRPLTTTSPPAPSPPLLPSTSSSPRLVLEATKLNLNTSPCGHRSTPYLTCPTPSISSASSDALPWRSSPLPPPPRRPASRSSSTRSPPPPTTRRCSSTTTRAAGSSAAAARGSRGRAPGRARR